MLGVDASYSGDPYRSFAARSGGLGVSAAVHALVLLTQLGAGGSGGTVTAASPSPPPAAEIVLAPAEDDTYPGLNPLDDEPDDVADVDDAYEELNISDATFDVARVADRAEVLFPFISPGLVFELFALRPQDAFERFLNSPMTWSPAHEPPETGRALTLTPADMQSLIDRAWARRDRWEAVQPVLKAAKGHHPDRGDAARLVREYAEQNLGQYYEDPRGGERDPRFWTELILAAEHTDFIRFIRDYVSAHPGTRTTIELLFVLDKVIESNRNILGTLRSIDPQRDLALTRTRSQATYALALELKARYGRVLMRKGLRSELDITRAYAAVRLAILQGVLRTTPDGYRAGDAHAMVGWIQWGLGNVEAAFDAWCAIVPGPSDEYVEVAADLLAAARVPAGADLCTTRRPSLEQLAGIDRILRRERGRLWSFQYRRLSDFGYSLSMY